MSCLFWLARTEVCGVLSAISYLYNFLWILIMTSEEKIGLVLQVLDEIGVDVATQVLSALV
jgi:hypothetical protein